MIEYQKKYPLPKGLSWVNKDTIAGTLSNSIYPGWNYGWVEPRPHTSTWCVCLWLNQKNNHIDNTNGFPTKEEAVEYLWLKFTLEGVPS